MEMENNFHRRIFIEADITVPSLYIQRAPFFIIFLLNVGK